MKAIVTGSNGFIGRNLIRTLVMHGVEVCAVSRSHEGTVLSSLPNIHLIECDFSNLPRLDELVDGPQDVFYHMAWAGTTGKERSDYALQLNNARHVCDAAIVSKKLGCSRFVAPGTITEKIVPFAVENHKTSQNIAYAIAKVAAFQMLETVCTSEHIDYIWARLSNIFGGDNTNGNLISYTLSEFKESRRPTYGPCLQPYNFTYIDDVTEALYALGTFEGSHRSSYLVSNGEVRVLKDYITEIADMFGGQVGIGERPDDGLRYDREWFLDNGLQQDIGFTADYTFTQGLERIKAETEGIT